jgi:hypothetical protein
MQVYRSLEQRLKNQHETIEVIVAGLPVGKIYEKIAKDRWTIHDNIAHLAKYQPVFIERIDLILNNNDPFFERYSAETDPGFEEWRTWEHNKLFLRLKYDRLLICNKILNLPGEKLNRNGIHPKFGRLTILEWTEFFLLHEAHHIFTIFQLAHQNK